jgi:hypothetical protein
LFFAGAPAEADEQEEFVAGVKEDWLFYKSVIYLY